MLPTRIDAHTLPPPPGVIGSLRAGFDAIAAHISLILLPLALDLLLWLGPRLGVQRLMQPVLDEMGRLAPTAGMAAPDVSVMLEMYRTTLEKFNLLVTLRTLPVGLFSLMSGRLPALSPLGIRPIFELDSFGQLLGLFLVLTVVGWILGGLYFHQVASLVTTQLPGSAPSTVRRALTQTIAYCLIWVVLAWSVGLPALFVLYLGSAVHALLGQAILLFMGIAALWLMVPLFFSPHGMYVRQQNALSSILGGFRLTRFTLPGSTLFVMAVLLVGIGLNLLWAVPAEDSWLALVGILGHAFITTALLASSFIYYQDMSTWLQTVLEKLRAGMPAQKA